MEPSQPFRLRVPASVAHTAVILLAGGWLGLAHGILNHMPAPAIWGFLAASLATRILSIRLTATDQGVSFRNVLRSFELPWVSITDMEIKEAVGQWPGYMGIGNRRRVVITTVAGRRIVVTATTSMGKFGTPPTGRWFRELDRRRRAAATAGTLPS